MVRVWAGWWGVSELDGGDGSYGVRVGFGDRQVSGILGVRGCGRKEPIVDCFRTPSWQPSPWGLVTKTKSCLTHRPRHLIFGT